MNELHPPAQDRARLSLRNPQSEELVVENYPPPLPGQPAETGAATNADGKSLTLLEEFALRRQRPSAAQIAFSALCAAASIAFATLLYANFY